MYQTISVKLKLDLTEAEKEALRQVSLAYRDAMNYASQVAFENGKTANGTKLQKLVYYEIRDKFKLPSQMACNVPRQVGATYKSLWAKVKSNAASLKAKKSKKRYKGLDKPPKFVSRTCTLNYRRDYSFKAEQKVSLITLSGRIVVPYFGYNKHLNWIKESLSIGAAKIFYNKPTKTYYLIVSLVISVPKVEPTTISRVVGVDVGQRVLAVVGGTDNKSKFFRGKAIRHKANSYYKARQSLQRKGTRSAKRRLISLSGRERRFIADINHQISKYIAQANHLIGLEELTHIRKRTRSKSGKKASKKQRKANMNKAKWSFAELHSFIGYKSKLNGSVAIKVLAHYTSQACPKCGHTSKENRPNKGLDFDCVSCGYQLHADLVGARNIALRRSAGGITSAL
jgi:putative transposase